MSNEERDGLDLEGLLKDVENQFGYIQKDMRSIIKDYESLIQKNVGMKKDIQEHQQLLEILFEQINQILKLCNPTQFEKQNQVLTNLSQEILSEKNFISKNLQQNLEQIKKFVASQKQETNGSQLNLSYLQKGSLELVEQLKEKLRKKQEILNEYENFKKNVTEKLKEIT